MSTRISLQYLAFGDYSKGTECLWHVYYELLDNQMWLEVGLFRRVVVSRRIPAWINWCLGHTPWALWQGRQLRLFLQQHGRQLAFKMKQRGEL